MSDDSDFEVVAAPPEKKMKRVRKLASAKPSLGATKKRIAVSGAAVNRQQRCCGNNLTSRPFICSNVGQERSYAMATCGTCHIWICHVKCNFFDSFLVIITYSVGLGTGGEGDSRRLENGA